MPKSYTELIAFSTFEERFEYLKLRGAVGQSTFGFDRYLNQLLYTSKEWRRVRQGIIIRDDCCDLGIGDRGIYSKLIIHHINPITVEDIERFHSRIFDPDNLVCTTHDTHNAIHYGDASLLLQLPKERKKGDTLLW